MSYRHYSPTFYELIIISSMAPTGQKSKACQLLEAAYRGNLRRLQALGAELDDGKRGVEGTIAIVRDPLDRSALHFAAKEGYTDICKYLVEKVNFDVNVQDSKGKTPLQNAVEERRMSTVSYLLKKGADPNLSAQNGFGPLHSAAEQGEDELLCLLLSKGANVDALSRDGTPLQMAASRGKPEAVKILLDHYANPGLFFHHIPTPLSAAIKSKSLRCVELLLEAEADPDAVSCGATPLHYAVSEGETEMIRCLLKAGADPNETNKDGMTPLEVAALNGNRQDVTVLYPVTTRIKSYSDWSVDGIMRPANSNEAKEHRNLKIREKFEAVKSKGLQAFHKKDYDGAIVWFTKAMQEDPCDASVVSNRSLCFAHKNEGNLALEDAKACIHLKPDWPKAHYREGAAWNILGKFEQAANAFGEGLKLDPESKELQTAFQEASAKSMKK